MITVIAAGCRGPQSALDPAGRGAEQIAGLFWWLAGGAAVVWVAVVGLAVYVMHLRPERAHDERAAKRLILFGGFVAPVVVLGGYLTWGLAMLPGLLAPGPPDGLKVAVSGEQWWWRVRYPAHGGAEGFDLANELRLPLGERVELELSSPDVIHAFWVPSLAGKIDMIPGRTTRLVLEPTKTGTFRGACAEYCGSAHALMSFYVVVTTPEAFAEWRRRQARPATPPATPLAARGRDVFAESGCGACHAVRGTGADGRVGPDLTHVGSRVSLGAGILPNDPAAFARWLARTDAVKPGVHMPAFAMLPAADLQALAAYLDGLE